MQTTGKTTEPLLKKKGPELLRKPKQTRYLLFNLLDSHGLSAYCPLENNFHSDQTWEQHFFFQVIKWVNQSKRWLRWYLEGGKTQKWFFFFTLTSIWNEIGPSFRGNKKMFVIAVHTNCSGTGPEKSGFIPNTEGHMPLPFSQTLCKLWNIILLFYQD